MPTLCIRSKARQEAAIILSINSYIQLTKPSIMFLVLFTGATSLVLEGSLLSDPIRFGLVLLGLYLTGGAANGLNQYFEREIDGQMKRTYRRRPLPLGQLRPLNALIFSVSIGVIGIALFVLFFNWLTAAIAAATILFYSLYYTLYLKPNTHQNIVIGGIAGAMGPVGAWCAATGSVDLFPWLLFMIIFLWTPPHFWALALFCRDDYKKVGIPMMPTVKGEEATTSWIFWYSMVLFGVSLSLLAWEPGWLYFWAALLLGGQFVRKSYLLRRQYSEARSRSLFGYSIVYLFGLFGILIIEALLVGNTG